MKIKIYTNPNCPFSDQAKKFFKQKKIPFEEISLLKNEEARLAVIEKTGQMVTPVIEIDEEIIIGFEEEKLNELFKEKKQSEKKSKK